MPIIEIGVGSYFVSGKMQIEIIIGSSYFKEEWDGEITEVEVIGIDELGDIIYQYEDGMAFKEGSEIFKESVIGRRWAN